VAGPATSLRPSVWSSRSLTSRAEPSMPRVSASPRRGCLHRQPRRLCAFARFPIVGTRRCTDHQIRQKTALNPPQISGRFWIFRAARARGMLVAQWV
jgi:hypothetical protein